MHDHLDDIYDDLISGDPGEQHTFEVEDDSLITQNSTDFEDDEWDSDIQTFELPDHGDEGDEPAEDTPQYNFNSSIAENEIINELLKAKGILDPLAINMEGEDGSLTQLNFYELPYHEQLNILKANDDVNTILDPDEIEAVNFLRKNGVSLEETIEYYQRKAVEDHINSQSIAGLDVDQYSDEELYAIDLKNNFEELTNDEILLELQKQLEHPELFKKKVDKLRTEYNEIEQVQLQESVRMQEEQDSVRYQELESNLVTVAQSVGDIGGLDLDVDDKNEILSYILEKDINGLTPFIKSLNSPQQLFELAWFAVKGNDAFNIIHDYYKKEIEKVSRTSYEKGKQSASPQTPPAKQSPARMTIVRKGNTTQPGFRPNNDDITSIDDLYN